MVVGEGEIDFFETLDLRDISPSSSTDGLGGHLSELFLFEDSDRRSKARCDYSNCPISR